MQLKSFIHLIEKLQSEEDFRLFLEDVRWQGKPICHHCGSISDKHYKLKNGGTFKGLYKCKDCRSVTVGTMFDGSHLSFIGRGKATLSYC